MPAGELHVQLAVTFPRNGKVRKLNRYGSDARALRDLYVQMLLFCKDTKSDGFVGEDEIALLVYPDTEENGKRDAGRLAEVGLLERGAGGYQVSDWLQRNPSREAIERKSNAKARGARHANHRRWHVEQDNPDPDCEWCQKETQTSDQNTDLKSDQTTDKSSDQTSDQLPIAHLKRSDSTETESEEETESETVKPLSRRAPAGAETGSDADPDFAAFWDSYPRKVAKGQARKAWRTAVIKRGVDPKVIILAAEQYRDDPRRRSRGTEYTAHPATWLNGERWLEHQEDDSGTEPDDEDFWTA